MYKIVNTIRLIKTILNKIKTISLLIIFFFCGSIFTTVFYFSFEMTIELGIF